MNNNKYFRALVALVLSQTIYLGQAAYYGAIYPIRSYGDAMTVCPQTCRVNMTKWTGSWWITSANQPMCECFHDWPFCPLMIIDQPSPPCYPSP